MANWKPMSDEEFDRQYTEATRRGQESLKTEPQASAAFYDATNERLIIELKWGGTLSLPRRLLQGLRDADPRLVAQVRLLPRGAALMWEALKVDFSVEGLLQGRYGTQKWMQQLATEQAALEPARRAKKTGPAYETERQAA